MICLGTVDNIGVCPELNYHLKIWLPCQPLHVVGASECKKRSFCLIPLCIGVNKLAISYKQELRTSSPWW